MSAPDEAAVVEKMRARSSLNDTDRTAIATCLENGGLSLENAADRMASHVRTLQRRLARVDLSYQQLVESDGARSTISSSPM